MSGSRVQNPCAKPGGYPDLRSLCADELHDDVPFERGRGAAQVDRHVEHSAAEHSDQFALSMRLELKVQPANRAGVTGVGLIVLDELVGNAEARENPAIVGLGERAAGIGVSAGPQYEHSA